MSTTETLKALTADQIEKGINDSSLSPQPLPSIDLIVDESKLDYRPIIVDDVPIDEAPEAIPDDSTSESDDDQPPTPNEATSQFADLKTTDLDQTVIGGAVVDNVCLVVPDEHAASFAGLPVIPIKGSAGVQAQMLASVPRDEAQGRSNQLPVLLLPDEKPTTGAVAAAVEKQPLTDIVALSNIIKSTPKIDEDADSVSGDKDIVKTELDDYVLSGDIKNLFGIKGLKARLYKFKGPGKKIDKEDESGAEDQDGDGDADDNVDSEDDSEPAREKVILNPDSYALKGKPLGTLFPFINDIDLQKMPITNLAFTYCEEKQSAFFPPGLRLEADVELKDSMQWASDALKSMFGSQKTPESIHLSAHLADERDWTKRPRIEKLVLQGYFHDMGLKTWDILQFKTMGVEITGTKAGRTKKGDKEEGNDDGKDEEDEGKLEGKDNTSAKDAPKDTTKAKPEKPESGAVDKPEPATKDTEPGPTNDAEDTAEPEEAEDKEEDDDKKKPKEKQSWNFGFGFFGTLMFTKVPHANAPVELNYRIGRDFEVDESADDADDKKDDKDENDESGENGEKDDKTDAEKNAKVDKDTTQPPAKDIAKVDAETPAGKTSKKLQKPKKQWSDGEHKRMWNLVIWCDEWDDIYGIKNISLKKAELKSSFEQGKFKETVRLDLLADLKLGSGTFTVTGEISKNENSLDAKIGDLKLSEIKKIHAQIAGYEVPEDDKSTDTKAKEEEETDAKEEAKGNELTFKELHLNLSSKKRKEEKTTERSLQLDGHVTFNEHASSSALLKINQDGLTINGDIKEFNIPDTSVKIQKAGLNIYVAFKQDKKKKVKGKKGKKTAKSITDKPAPTEQDRKAKPADMEKAVADGGKAVTKPDDAKEKKDNDKPTKPKRESQFSILGIVQIEKFVVKVGLHVEQKKDKQNREWLAIGSVKSLRLSELWPDLQGGFLDLELDNLALIGSSEEREVKEDSEDEASEEKSKETSEETGEEESENEKPASWDVLAEVDSYNYPIAKGVQLCATIRKFDALEKLNNDQKLDGLVLIVGFSFKGKLEIRINMPKSMEIPLRDYAKLGEFGAAIATDNGLPYLQLNTTLKMLFDDQPPIRVRGNIKGAIDRAEGQLYMDSKDSWINPFSLNKNVVVSKLGIGAGFKYATVVVHGPDRLQAAGKIKVGKEFEADMALSLGIGKDQVISFNISEINIMELVKLAGEMADIKALKNIEGADDILVFRDLKLYLSTGASVFDVYYERGIHIKGSVEFLKKKGDFEGRLNDDGFMIKAGVDNFNIGGLELRSAKDDGKRASIDITMTKETQKILIDGMIRFHALHLKMYIDADVQERRLDADVSIQFLEQLSFKMKAKARIPETKTLDGLLVRFEAELRPDLFGAIFDGINNGIDAIGKLATQTIDDAIKDLQGQTDTHEGELAIMKKELDQMKLKSDAEVLERQNEVNNKNDELTRLRNELDGYDQAVKDAQAEKNQNSDEIKAKQTKRDSAQRQLDNKLREKRTEYEGKVAEQRQKQADFERKKKSLEDQKEASWGDSLRKGEDAERSWRWWQDEVQKAYVWKEQAWQIHLDAGFFNKLPTWFKFQEANAGLEQIKVRRDANNEILKFAREIVSTPAFRQIEYGINDAVREIDRFGRAVDSLTRNGVYGYIQEMSRDERTELDRQIRQLNELREKSKELEANLQRAIDALEKNQGRITSEERAVQSRILKLEQEIELKPFEDAYRNKKNDHDRVVAQVQVIQQTLKDIRNGIDAHTKAAKEVVEVLKKATPRITLIVVKASTEVFAKNEPLVFSVDVAWIGETKRYEVTWSPGSKPADLYKDVADKVVGFR